MSLWVYGCVRVDAGPSGSCGLELACLLEPGCPEQFSGEAATEVGSLSLQAEWRALSAPAEALVAVPQGPLGLISGADEGTGKCHPEGSTEGGAAQGAEDCLSSSSTPSPSA